MILLLALALLFLVVAVYGGLAPNAVFWLLLIGFLFFKLFAWRSWGRGPWGYGGGHYHDHTHGPTPTTPPATKPEDPTIA